MNVKDIMSTDLITVTPETTIGDCARLMRDNHVGSICVTDNDDQLMGILTDRDIVNRVIAEGLDPEAETCDDFCTKDNLVTCSPNDDLQTVEKLMADNKIRRVPVLENNKCVGIVSLGDIAMAEDKNKAGETLHEISEPTPEERAVA